MDNLIIGRFYNLTLSDDNADDGEYFNCLKKYSGIAKLIGVGQINCLDQEYSYVLFRNIETDEIIEVSNNTTLVFFEYDFRLGYFSSFVENGKEFPEFGGPTTDCYPHVKIKDRDYN